MEDIETSDKFIDLRSKVVKHLTNQYLEGKLKWIQILLYIHAEFIK